MAIKLLSPQLIGQIAAGEIIERPVSVVKELIENSLDAGATKILINIERGGIGMIRVHDNGIGISKTDLKNSLARHSTSKISSQEDLYNIFSMGFRGEALASISSVSKLKIISCTCDQDIAWQIYIEGKDMMPNMTPAAHPTGTTVEILELFYNVPVRRKFMCSEKTEFYHIEELVRRIALVHVEVDFILKHNGCIKKKYISNIGNDIYNTKRLYNICGKSFVKNSITIFSKFNDLIINGRIMNPKYSFCVSDFQYNYVNKRFVRNKLMTHAVSQAYYEHTDVQRKPVFFLSLNINPRCVDVNVHPNKLDVRFYESRLIHDCIYQSVSSTLKSYNFSSSMLKKSSVYKNKFCSKNQSSDVFNLNIISNKNVEFNSSNYFETKSSIHDVRITNTFDKYFLDTEKKFLSNCIVYDFNFNLINNYSLGNLPFKNRVCAFGQLLTIYPPCYALIEQSFGNLLLLSLVLLNRYFIAFQLVFEDYSFLSRVLLIPERILLKYADILLLVKYKKILENIGFFLYFDNYYIILFRIPFILFGQNLEFIFMDLLKYLSSDSNITIETLACWLARKLIVYSDLWNYVKVVQLINMIEKKFPSWIKTPPIRFFIKLNLDSVINNFLVVD